MNDISLQNYILRTGTGCSINKLTAFNRALIAAGVSNYNLVKVSSILPPNCYHRNEIALSKGLLLPSAFSSIYSDRIGDILSSSVAIGIPSDSDNIGIIMEHSALSSKDETEKTARVLVIQAMQDRDIPFSEIISVAVECSVVTAEFYCAFATVSMW